MKCEKLVLSNELKKFFMRVWGSFTIGENIVTSGAPCYMDL